MLNKPKLNFKSRFESINTRKETSKIKKSKLFKKFEDSKNHFAESSKMVVGFH